MTLALALAALSAHAMPLSVLAALAAVTAVAIVAGSGARTEGDAGAGSPPDDGSDSTGDDDAGLAADSGAVGGHDSEDDDDPDAVEDDHSDLPFKDHPRFKTTLNKNRRLQRWRAKNQAVVERVRLLGGPEALDRMLVGSQQADRFTEMLAQNPQLRALVNGGQADDPARGSATAQAKKLIEQMPQFDESHEATGFMRLMATAVDELREQNAALLKQVSGVTSGLTQERQAVDTREFTTAVDAALKALPKNLQGTFRDAVIGAKRHAVNNGVRISNQALVDHYLADLGINRKQQEVASAAAATRIAQNNQRLPGRQAQVGGTPASPVRTRETVTQLNARLRSEGRFR